MTKGVSNALIYTLSAHVVVLFTLTRIQVSDETPASELYTEIEFVSAEQIEQAEQQVQAEFQNTLDEKIANLRANAQSDLSSEARSTGLSAAERAALDAQVEQELADLESSEMERLSADKKEFDTVGLPDEQSDSRPVDTMDDWDKQHDGRVTVKFDLTDRSPQNLDVPGYLCRGRADVIVSIVVDRQGKVLSADLISGTTPGSCFALAALRSAKASKFIPSPSAPRSQQGTLTYAFIAQ